VKLWTLSATGRLVELLVLMGRILPWRLKPLA